jgi:hypothetical protein
MRKFLILALLVAGGCMHRQPMDAGVELWDVGNVFVQPRQTLIFSLRADGRVVAREGATGKPDLDLTLLQVPKAAPLVGQIDPREACRILRQIETAGVLKVDKHAGFITVDGPAVRLVFRFGAGSNEIQHVALDDARYHAQMNTPEQRQFLQAWDHIGRILRGIRVENWRPLKPEDGIRADIPWKQEGK